MDKVSDYDVVKSSKLDELITMMKTKIKEGWMPLDGVQSHVQPAPGGGGYITYLQTIVKRAS